MTRSVLSGMCALAARRDVMKSNPVRDTTPIRARPQRPAQPLDEDQLRHFRKSLLESEVAHELDVVDLVQFMIATGCRLGEALALQWSNLDLPKAAVEIGATAIRVKGQGVLIKDSPKTASSVRVLEVPPGASRCSHDDLGPVPWSSRHRGADPFEIPRTRSGPSTEPLATRSSPTVTARPSPRLWTTLACPPARPVIN